jgi:VWFA-related protein
MGTTTPAPAAPLEAQEPISSEQEPTPTFPAEVELVTVDVVVVDGDGNPVTGLKQEDFEVKEDGQLQPIDNFEAVELEAPEPPSAAPTARGPAANPPPRRYLSRNFGKQDTGRTFALVFDDINLTTFSAHRAKGAAAEFLKRGLRPGDRVMLAATSGDVWWSAQIDEGREAPTDMLGRLEGKLVVDLSPERITPWEAVQIHVYRNSDVAFRVTRRLEKYNAIPAGAAPRPMLQDALDHPLLLQRAREVYMGATSRLRLTLDAIDRVLVGLESAKGRKGLILVSEGFIYDTSRPELKRVVRSALRSNVVAYFVDARGLEGMPVELTAQFGLAPEARDLGINALGGGYLGAATFLQGDLSAEGAQNIAVETGGFTVKNTNDLGSGIARIARESEAYYMIGYYPTNAARDGSYRDIDVEVRKKGVRVRARKGYYAPLPGEQATRLAAGDQPRFQSALDSPYDQPDVPLRMASYVLEETLLERAKVLVVADVDIRELAFDEVDSRFVDALEYIMVVAHRQSGEHFRYDEKVEMDFSPQTRAAVNQSWYSIAKSFDLQSGEYQARIVVSDRNAGRIGSVIHDFEVPDLGGLRVSTPIMTDSIQRSSGGLPRPVLRLPRRYARGAVLYCEYEVYGATRDGTGMPRVSAGYSIRHSDGRTIVEVPPSLIRPSSLGQLSRFIGAPLEGAAEGDYELVLTLRDEVAGADVEVREPFSIGGAQQPREEAESAGPASNPSPR